MFLWGHCLKHDSLHVPDNVQVFNGIITFPLMELGFWCSVFKSFYYRSTTKRSFLSFIPKLEKRVFELFRTRPYSFDLLLCSSQATTL